MPNLQIELLGHFFLRYDGEPLARLHQARQQELLAYLVLHRRAPQARRHLAFLFWPDSTESQARTNLRQLLHDLRRALPAAGTFLQMDAQSVRWRVDAPFTLDAADFERAIAEAGNPATDSALLERAVLSYAGALLPGCYADWILPDRERLGQYYEQALARLVVLLEEQQEYERALRYGQRLLRHDPLHEATYLRMMRLHALNGDRASALRTYHICATLLGRELGVEPNDELQAAYEHLLNLHPPPVVREVARSARGKDSHLIGRQAEWRRLQAAWHSALRGRLHFVLVTGEAGMGKTHLAEEMLSWAGQQGIATAYTRAYAAVGAGGLAYAPVVNWLRSDVLQQSLVRLDAVWLTELARLCPELLVARPDLNRPEPLTERWQRQRLFEALARTFMAVDASLLLVLDDLQWCDLETLEWLHYLLRHTHGMDAQHPPPARLLVLGTMRPEEVDSAHPLTALLLNLRRTNLLTELVLTPLDGQETAALAAQVAGRELDSEARHRLYQATEGNPLFVVEMMRASSGEQGKGIGSLAAPSSSLSLPPKVQAVIQARLAQLSPSSRELACLAAVVGRSFTFPVLAQASALAEDVLIRGLDELWQRRIIRERGENAYDFSHDRIRDVAYAEASLARRRFLHRRVAQVLEVLHRDDLSTVSDQLGRHYEQALQLEKAVKYYRQAAAASAELYAFESVLLYLDRVLILLGKLPATAEGIRQQIESWIETANTLVFTKGWMAIERKQALDRAYELAKQVGDEAHQLEAVEGLHGYYANRGEWYIVYNIAQEMVLLAEKLEDPRHLCMAYHGLANTYLHRGEFLASLQYQRRVIAIDAELGSPELNGVSPRSRMAEALWYCGYPEQAQRPEQT